MVKSPTGETVLYYLLKCRRQPGIDRIQIAPNKKCILDAIPTWVIKRCCSALAPAITNVIELSFEEGIFPESHKHAVVRPRIKTPSLDPLNIRSFRPISNLSFISKLTERLVVNRYNEHAGVCHLLPVRQSAYRQHHSTETAITIMHNDIVRISMLVRFLCSYYWILVPRLTWLTMGYYLKYFKIDLVFKIMHSIDSSRTYLTAPNRFV